MQTEGPSNFQVVPDTLETTATVLETVLDEMSELTSAPQAMPSDALTGGLSGALDSFYQAWAYEVQQAYGLAETLIDSMRAAAQGYAETDHAVKKSMFPAEIRS